jgi:hypothetical protein
VPRKSNKKMRGLKHPNKSQNASGKNNLGAQPPVPGQKGGKRSPFGMSKGKKKPNRRM